MLESSYYQPFFLADTLHEYCNENRKKTYGCKQCFFHTELGKSIDHINKYNAEELYYADNYVRGKRYQLLSPNIQTK